MTNIKAFAFNPFKTNTYLLWDESKEAIIIDAAMYFPEEKEIIKNFINENKLKLKTSISTHAHVDHILGNQFIKEEFGLLPQMHNDTQIFLENAKEYANSFGFTLEEVIRPEILLNEGDKIKYGNSELDVILTPGHAAGSICLSNKEEKFVFAGDVLFNRGIGRTDLPTGDFGVLSDSIQNKLYKLADETVVYPGHGEKTSIGSEKENNPYVDGY